LRKSDSTWMLISKGALSFRVGEHLMFGLHYPSWVFPLHMKEKNDTGNL